MADALHRVLVVDDDPAVLLVMRNALEAAGFAATTVQSGWAALSELCAATAGDDPYDAMLLDLAMPGVDGWGVLDAVRTNPLWIGMKAIVVSGYHQSAQAFSRVIEHDGVFIEKGPDFERLVLHVLNRLTAA